MPAQKGMRSGPRSSALLLLHASSPSRALWRECRSKQRPQVLLYDQSSQRCTKLPGIQSFHSVLGVLTRTSSPHRPLLVHSSPGAPPTHASHLAVSVRTTQHVPARTLVAVFGCGQLYNRTPVTSTKSSVTPRLRDLRTSADRQNAEAARRHVALSERSRSGQAWLQQQRVAGLWGAAVWSWQFAPRVPLSSSRRLLPRVHRGLLPRLQGVQARRSVVEGQQREPCRRHDAAAGSPPRGAI